MRRKFAGPAVEMQVMTSTVRPARRRWARQSIRTLAQLTGLTLRAIRLYEERGLIASTRDTLGMRWFDLAMSERVEFIAIARRAGLSLAEVEGLLATGDRLGHGRRAIQTLLLLRIKVESLDRQREAVEDCVLALDFTTDRDERTRPANGKASDRVR